MGAAVTDMSGLYSNSDYTITPQELRLPDTLTKALRLAGQFNIDTLAILWKEAIDPVHTEWAYLTPAIAAYVTPLGHTQVVEYLARARLMEAETVCPFEHIRALLVLRRILMLGFEPRVDVHAQCIKYVSHGTIYPAHNFYDGGDGLRQASSLLNRARLNGTMQFKNIDEETPDDLS